MTTEQAWSDKQLLLMAETMIVGKFGIEAVYAELKRVRDTERATLTAQLQEAETRWTHHYKDTMQIVVDAVNENKQLTARIAALEAELAQAQAGQYSHRNGESDAPTETGWYWFLDDHDMQMLHVTMWDYPPQAMIYLDNGDGRAITAAELEGIWYGPVTPPQPDS